MSILNEIPKAFSLDGSYQKLPTEQIGFIIDTIENSLESNTIYSNVRSSFLNRYINRPLLYNTAFTFFEYYFIAIYAIFPIPPLFRRKQRKIRLLPLKFSTTFKAIDNT